MLIPSVLHIYTFESTNAAMEFSGIRGSPRTLARPVGVHSSRVSNPLQTAVRHELGLTILHSNGQGWLTQHRVDPHPGPLPRGEGEVLGGLFPGVALRLPPATFVDPYGVALHRLIPRRYAAASVRVGVFSRSSLRRSSVLTPSASPSKLSRTRWRMAGRYIFFTSLKLALKRPSRRA